jgi:hypothetical protein
MGPPKPVHVQVEPAHGRGTVQCFVTCPEMHSAKPMPYLG